ncbi:MAG: hypothetical protein KDI88_12960, partial [Gammaproteobacteria bacterium]|nr:hypothetical protein [Gammaproteobacteria bacterium]
LFADQRATGPWSFFPPGTEGYDYFHQKIFRQYATEVVPVDELDPPPPPLPPAPKGPFPTWAENQGKGRPADSGRHPSLASRLKGAGEDGLPVYVVLIEDHHESMFGDGKSLDLQAASLDRERAESIAGRPHSQYETLSLRKFALRLSGDRLVSRDYDPQRYEHYPLESVLALLERELRAIGEVAAGQAG